jgi:uncharacterized membrane protein YbaN (DUF454 family)
MYGGIKVSVIVKRVLGSVMILLGLSGIVLPVLPGWVFIFGGIYLISPRRHKSIKNWLIKFFRLKGDVT